MDPLLVKVPEGKGMLEVPVQGLDWIKLFVLRLDREESFSLGEADKELGCILTLGKIKVKVEDKSYVLGPRVEVFNSKPWGIYIPPNKKPEITSLTSSEIIVAKVKSEPTEMGVTIISPNEVERRMVGIHNWKRYVTQVIDDTKGGRHIIMGETVNPPGNWSSYPPHKHDKHNPPLEWQMEEVYLYRINPQEGFGIQKIYTEEGDFDQTITVSNNTAIPITRGYHPVVAAPGYSLYYLWVLGGKEPVNIPRDDPKHSWVKRIEPVIKEL